MLARPYRLPSSVHLYHPKTITREAFLLKYARSRVSHSRCSVVISKKVDKRATKRNEIRRSILEPIRLPLKTMSTPWDILIIVKRLSAEMSREEIQKSVISVFQKDLL